MQTICKVAKPKEHDQVIFSKERINSEQRKQVIINLNPTFVMATRHRVTHLHNAHLRWLATNNLTRPQTRNFPDDWFSNLGEFNTGFTECLRLKDGSVPSLFGPTGSIESQTVSMINNRCLYFLSSNKNMEL